VECDVPGRYVRLYRGCYSAPSRLTVGAGVVNGSDPSACSTTGHTVSDRQCAPLSTVVGYMGGTGALIVLSAVLLQRSQAATWVCVMSRHVPNVRELHDAEQLF
jgi:hypothetical protein